MHLFVYEWVTGGGMIEHSLSEVPSLLTEGAAMARALAADFGSLDGVAVTVMRDIRVVNLSVPGCEVREVDSRGSHDEHFESLCESADATVLIAPESDAILLRAIKMAQASGAQLISPGLPFATIAANKATTAQLLEASGVPVPPSRTIEPDERLPFDFAYPAVIKPLDGAGSQDIYVVASPHDVPPPYAWPRRLEGYISGMPASVAVLLGPLGPLPLGPCRQVLSTEGQLRYLGGRYPLPEGLAERATRLAISAVEALPTTRGFVGVDLVLGGDPDGSEDAVIEINPRLTTSYIGLRKAARQNLGECMWHHATGKPVVVEFDPRPIEFEPDGAVAFTRQ